VLSGRGICDELITRPEESYRLCCVVRCGLETSRMRRSWSNGGLYVPIHRELSESGDSMGMNVPCPDITVVGSYCMSIDHIEQ